MIGGDGGHRKKVSLIGALSVSPRTHRLGFYFATAVDGYFCAEKVVTFLRNLLRHLPGKVVGISKLARVVEDISHRPQVQERMTHQIADLMAAELGAKGVVVVLEATHTCMAIRGVRKTGSIMTTSSMRGTFRTNPATRSELLALVYGPR